MYPFEAGPGGVGGNKPVKQQNHTHNNKQDKPNNTLGGVGSLFDMNDPMSGGSFWMDINGATAEGLTVKVNPDGKGGKTSIFSDGTVAGYGSDNSPNYYDFSNNKKLEQEQIQGYVDDLENMLSDKNTKVNVDFVKDGVFRANYPDGTSVLVDSSGKPLENQTDNGFTPEDKQIFAKIRERARKANTGDGDASNVDKSSDADKSGNAKGGNKAGTSGKTNGYTEPGVMLKDIDDAIRQGQSVDITGAPDDGKAMDFSDGTHAEYNKDGSVKEYNFENLKLDDEYGKDVANDAGKLGGTSGSADDADGTDGTGVNGRGNDGGAGKDGKGVNGRGNDGSAGKDGTGVNGRGNGGGAGKDGTGVNGRGNDGGAGKDGTGVNGRENDGGAGKDGTGVNGRGNGGGAGDNGTGVNGRGNDSGAGNNGTGVNGRGNDGGAGNNGTGVNGRGNDGGAGNNGTGVNGRGNDGSAGNNGTGVNGYNNGNSANGYPNSGNSVNPNGSVNGSNGTNPPQNRNQNQNPNNVYGNVPNGYGAGGYDVNVQMDTNKYNAAYAKLMMAYSGFGGFGGYGNYGGFGGFVNPMMSALSGIMGNALMASAANDVMNATSLTFTPYGNNSNMGNMPYNMNMPYGGGVPYGMGSMPYGYNQPYNTNQMMQQMQQMMSPDFYQNAYNNYAAQQNPANANGVDNSAPSVNPANSAATDDVDGKKKSNVVSDDEVDVEAPDSSDKASKSKKADKVDTSDDTDEAEPSSKDDKPAKTNSKAKSKKSNKSKSGQSPTQLTNKIFKAIDGLGTDEKALEQVYSEITPDNVIDVMNSWDKFYAKKFTHYNHKTGESHDSTLISALESDLSGEEMKRMHNVFKDALVEKAKASGNSELEKKAIVFEAQLNKYQYLGPMSMGLISEFAKEIENAEESDVKYTEAELESTELAGKMVLLKAVNGYPQSGDDVIINDFAQNQAPKITSENVLEVLKELNGSYGVKSLNSFFYDSTHTGTLEDLKNTVINALAQRAEDCGISQDDVDGIIGTSSDSEEAIQKLYEEILKKQ
ncbi:MAG: hypothetical protein ACI37S_03815 [Candidatus Gastranaerophilaceae bacterium]